MTVIPEDPEFFHGCLWPVAPECVDPEWQDLDEDLKIRSLALASNSLERLVAYRVTACPVTIRPCPPGCGCPTRDCYSCSSGCELTLPYVGRVVEVIVDGEIQDIEDYEVQDSRHIVYVGDGTCPFTRSQNLRARLGEPGTWGVTYLPGEPVDTLGAQAVTLLAMEFAKACLGSSKCKLPKGVRTVSRFGMTYEVDTGLFDGGYTGIELTDAFIDLWNPQNRSGPAVVYSPDMPQPRTVVR